MTSIDRAQADKAVNALLKHHEKVSAERAETELLERDEHVWLVINTKRGSTKRKMMPKRIQLPNPPLPPPPATTIAIITKPPQRTYKDLLASPEHNIKFINRVVDTDKLRGKWKPFEARRNLARENDLWLADERVIPSLPKLLGKVFFDAKKQPIPVNLQRKDLKAELGRAINSTYFHPSTGTSHSIRIATAGSTSASETLDNLLAAVPLAVKHIEDEWENVLSVGIKTSTSVLLPIYNSKLEGRFDVKEKAKKADGEGDVEMDGKAKKSKGKGKDKKRGAPEEDVEDKVEKVEKKAKASPVKADKAEKAEKEGKTAAKEVKKTKAVAGAGGKVDKTARKKVSSAGDAGKRAKEAVLGKKK